MPIDCVDNHHLLIYDRGAKRRLKEIIDLTQVKWNRIRDDTSDAQIDLNGRSCTAQSDFLSEIEPGRHEAVIYRGDERVWEGPITRCSYTRSSMSIYARDITHYLYKTAMRVAYSSANPNIETVTGRIERIIRAEVARKEALGYNILDFLDVRHFAGEAKTSAVTKAYESTVWEHLDSLAAKSGIDYVTVGRQLVIWDTSNPIGQTRMATENDFLGELEVNAYGMDLVTRAISTDGQGNFGIAGPETDPYYGEVEQVYTAYDEESGETQPTQSELQSQAERNLNGHNPTPVLVRIPDGSTLNPNGVLSLSDLVPGVYIPLQATLPARTFSQMQKLSKMEVTETADGETITVSMAPASQSDDTGEDED